MRMEKLLTAALLCMIGNAGVAALMLGSGMPISTWAMTLWPVSCALTAFAALCAVRAAGRWRRAAERAHSILAGLEMRPWQEMRAMDDTQTHFWDAVTMDAARPPEAPPVRLPYVPGYDAAQSAALTAHIVTRLRDAR